MLSSCDAALATFMLPPTFREVHCYEYLIVLLFSIYYGTSFGLIASACINWLCTLLLVTAHKFEPVALAVRDIVLGSPDEDIDAWVRDQKSIINFSSFDVSKPDDTLPIRAEANNNIAVTFGITNSLTTVDPDVHKAFIKTASSIINRPDRAWKSVFQTATRYLSHELAHGSRPSLALAEATRITCLAVVLVDNFNITSSTNPSLPRDSLIITTQEINNQWLKAKSSPPHSQPSPSPLLNKHISSLNLTLRSSDQPLKPEEILSIIMPQYETLWRVVLVTYLHAFHPYARPTLRNRIAVVPDCLGTNSVGEKEALKLAKEGLRLTPSNKRIYRHSPTATWNQKVKADLELLHRHPSIWGPTALEFNPSRFDNLTSLQQEAYLPYSIRPHRCPAFSGFGDRMVTCLVVAMGRVLDTSAGRIHNSAHHHGRAERAGVIGTARDELEGWRYTPCK